MRAKLVRSMQDCDRWVVEFDYRDSKGKESKRVVSPVRFLSNERFLGFCLSREEPRQFYLSRIQNLELQPAENYVIGQA